MIEFGKTLRTAREAKGYTVAQLAEITKLVPSAITDLEKEDFSHIAAPIYGRGFVKLYCEAVGLDPKPLVNEFMEILNGKREPQIRERQTVVPEPEPVAVPEPEPVAAPEPEPVAVPEPEPVAAPEPEPIDNFHLEAETMPAEPLAEMPAEPPPEMPAEPRFSRYASPFNDDSTVRGRFDTTSVPVFRWAILACAAALVIAALVFGIRALYRATTDRAPVTAPQEDRTTAPTPAPPAPQATTAAPRTSRKIPDIYVD